MADRGVAPCHVGRRSRIAGIYVPEIVAADLSADILAVGIVIHRRFRRLYPGDQVAVGDPLGGAVRPYPGVVQPLEGDVVRREALAAAVDELYSGDGVVGVVVRRCDPADGVDEGAAVPLPERLRGIGVLPEITDERPVALTFGVFFYVPRSPSLDRLAEKASADASVPRALDAAAQSFDIGV